MTQLLSLFTAEHKSILIHTCSFSYVLNFSEMLSGTSCSVLLKSPDKGSCLTTEIPRILKRLQNYSQNVVLLFVSPLSACDSTLRDFRWRKHKVGIMV